MHVSVCTYVGAAYSCITIQGADIYGVIIKYQVRA